MYHQVLVSQYRQLLHACAAHRQLLHAYAAHRAECLVTIGATRVGIVVPPCDNALHWTRLGGLKVRELRVRELRVRVRFTTLSTGLAIESIG